METESTADRITQALDSLEVSDAENTAVFAQVRKLGKDTAAKLKESEEATALAQKELQAFRGSAVKGFVDGLGLTGLDVSILDGRLDGTPTEKSVREALTKLGIPVGEAKGSSTEEAASEEAAAAEEAAATAEAAETADDLGKVADLGQRVDSAAAGNSETDLITKLTETKSPEDIEQVMAEAGFLL